MIQHRLGVKPRDPPPLRPKCHKSHGNPRRDPRPSVRLGIAHQHRPRHDAPRALDRRDIRCRLRLPHRQRIGPHQRIEQAPHPQPRHQRLGQAFRLVRADRRGKAPRPQHLHRRHRAGIKPRLPVDPFRIGRQQPGILRVNRCFRPVDPQPRESQPQHRPPAVKGRQRIARLQHIAMPQVAETGIRRRQQIGGCIRQRPVQIKDHRPPPLQHRETLREAGLSCGPP